MPKVTIRFHFSALLNHEFKWDMDKGSVSAPNQHVCLASHSRMNGVLR
jgi:hypothetical protein